LLTLDTTRADRIGAYGYQPAQTPTIDGFATSGVLFNRAYATVPLTTPSHASILTGLYPPRHGIRNNGDAILPEEATTLAETLNAYGYHTAASVSAFVTTKVWNLDQGFDVYFDEIQQSETPGNRWGQERPAQAVVDDLVGWLDEKDTSQAPFFLWAHFYDPHHPYQPPPPYDTGFAHPYDGEIAYMDSQIQRLKSHVEAIKGDRDVVWIVVADHGESFDRDHGEITHGLFVFDSTMRVPFIFQPAQPLQEPVVITQTTASIVDVTPTALGLLNLPVPSDLDGVDLSGATSHSVHRTGVYMESLSPQQRFGYHPEIAVAEGPLKLIDTPNPHLYNVDDDPEEQHNIIGQHPDNEAHLREIARRTWATQSISNENTPAPEVYEQLEALGYVSNDFVHDDTPTVDAKDKIHIISEIESIRAHGLEHRDFEETARAYQKLIETEPNLSEARMGLARALGVLGRDAEAEVVYREALEIQPDSAILRVNLGNCLAAQNRHEEGLAEMLSVLERVPGDAIAQIGVLRMMTDLDRDEEATDLVRTWLLEKPNDPALQAHLGVLLVRNGNLQEGERSLRASLSDEVPRQLVHRSLATVELQKQHPRLALMHYRKEIHFFAVDPNLYLRTARVLMTLNEWNEAAVDYERFVTATPDSIEGRQEWAQAVFNTEDYIAAADILQPALLAAPENPDVLLLHANILAKLGRRTEAVEIAAKANELNRLRIQNAQ